MNHSFSIRVARPHLLSILATHQKLLVLVELRDAYSAVNKSHQLEVIMRSSGAYGEMLLDTKMTELRMTTLQIDMHG